MKKHVKSLGKRNVGSKRRQSSNKTEKQGHIISVKKIKSTSCIKGGKKSVASNVDMFKKSIQEGPFFICIVCNRCLYRKSVLCFKREKYSTSDSVFCFVASFDGLFYICKTCGGKLMHGKIPCQSVYNKLHIQNLPTHFKNIRRLEKVLVSKRILFKKITIMPKGQAPKIKGAVCNVPIDNNDLSSILPRPADSNGIVVVKLKRKLQYKGHVYFESVRPQFVYDFLCYLKTYNHLYSDVIINTGNISNNLLALGSDNDDGFEVLNSIDSIDTQIPIILEDCESELELGENPLDQFRTSANETCLISNIPCEDNECINIAPGEGKKTVSVFSDQYCEELAHPYLFPTGKYGFKVARDVPLSPVKYFNQRLLNYTQKFSSDADYIFFAHSYLQQLSLKEQISIAMKKVSGTSLTAGMLSGNFKEKVKEFIATDQAYTFMNSIKGTPAYWKKFKSECLAMVRQLGIPQFFLTLSCADLRWNELVSIISKLNSVDVKNFENLSYHERCDILNSNPVLVARHFQNRVELFFRLFVLDGPLGKTQYYAIRVEFQVRGSPHIHSFIWVLDAPILTEETVEDYVQWVDSIISAQLPDHQINPSLHHLVKTYQMHRHSHTCRKYKKDKCRFHFGHFFTNKTIVAKPLPKNMPLEEKNGILAHRQKVLNTVSDYINNDLNPAKLNIFDPSRDDYTVPLSIVEILRNLGLSEQTYYEALSISDDNDFQIHLARQPNSCFVNNFFAVGLEAWEANMDIQPVFNEYKAIAYMCAYLSKTEDSCTRAMSQALAESLSTRQSNYEQMRAIAHAYATNRECSLQEAVYHILPELWLRKTFPGVIFANSNTPDRRYKIFRSKEEIDELPEDSTDVFKQSMVDKYVDRPNATFAKGKYSILSQFCFAEFLRYYYIIRPKPDNDSQPEELVDEDIELNHQDSSYPQTIPLMSSKQKLKCRAVPAVLRFHTPNKDKNFEFYSHHLLFLFYPFREEQQLKVGNPATYANKISQPGVLDIINRNKAHIEPYSDVVDDALAQYSSQALLFNTDPFAEQENDEVSRSTNDAHDDDDDDDQQRLNANETADFSSDVPFQTPFLSDGEMCELIRSLNDKQRQVFEYIFHWAKESVKNKSSEIEKSIPPFHIFLTGGGGCGKSHLIKAVYQAISKIFLYHGSNPEKPRVLLLAPTGVASININGTTLHSAFGLPCEGPFYPLNHRTLDSSRKKLSEVKLIIIDEISMVSKKNFSKFINDFFKYLWCSNHLLANHY